MTEPHRESVYYRDVRDPGPQAGVQITVIIIIDYILRL